MPSGRASFVVQYKTAQGATRRMVVSQIGAMTPDEARKLARLRLAEVEQGRDPSAARHETRAAKTVSELCADYLDAARARTVLTRFKRPKAPSTILNDESRILRHIIPLIGGKIASELTRADVQNMVGDITKGKTAAIVKTKPRGVSKVRGGAVIAARTVELLGGIYTWAEEAGFVSGENPTRRIKKQKGEANDRVLSRGELAALGRAIDSMDGRYPQACAALRLIALTGLRREEACGLRWREIDWEGSCLRLENTKTGRSTRPIGEAAVKHLKSLTKFHDAWVFPNRDWTGSADLKKSIAAIFDKAGLIDARSHDMRRTWATFAAELEYGDATIGELIGHARRGVTAVHYIRRPDAALVAAATRVAESIASAMDSANG
jgi:integrase